MTRFALPLFLAASAFAADTPGTQSAMVAHEWGTFTTVAAPTGDFASWQPLAGPADLPCFVHRQGMLNLKVAPSVVRMETPVLYFYAQRKTNVAVRVNFLSGLLTEWYPQVASTSGPGSLEWHLTLAPGESPEFPSAAGASHYFAARATDATPLWVGNEAEKMLFYRGVSDFAPPVTAWFPAEGNVVLRNQREDAVAMAILFENRGGKVGYRVVRGLQKPSTVAFPELTADVRPLKTELEGALVQAGLYPKEAAAMMATWSDSWFGEGMRVIYLVPRRFVDEALPMKVSPTPSSLVRVFVGRVELMAPYRLEAAEAALAAGDVKTLDSFGRFVLPFVNEVSRRRNWNPREAPAAAVYMSVKHSEVDKEYGNPSCVK